MACCRYFASWSGRTFGAHVIELRWETEIRASAERVFSLLVELRDYDHWLPRSASFRGTIEISQGPIAVGTTYVEPGPLGTRYGRLTELVRPMRLNFEQPMTMKPRALGEIGIQLFHTLTPDAGSVRLLRVLELSPRGPVSLVMPVAVRLFRSENDRMMMALKDFAEEQAQGDVIVST
jgi:uncharacterized protein YndB with AHSA1/START domain